MRRSSSRSDRPLAVARPLRREPLREARRPAHRAPGAAPRRETAASRRAPWPPPARAPRRRPTAAASATRASQPSARRSGWSPSSRARARAAPRRRSSGAGYPFRSKKPSTVAQRRLRIARAPEVLLRRHHRDVAQVLRAAGVAGHPPAAPPLLERAALHGGKAVRVGVGIVGQRIHAGRQQTRHAARVPRQVAGQAVGLALERAPARRTRPALSARACRRPSPDGGRRPQSRARRPRAPSPRTRCRRKTPRAGCAS